MKRPAGRPLVLELDGVHGFRDLGGHATVDGGTTRAGMVCRSANLDHLTEAGHRTLAELGVDVCLDLRAAFEVAAAPPAPGLHLPVAWVPLLDAASSDEYVDLLARRLGHRAADGYDLTDLAELVISEAGPALAAAFRVVADARCALFHCTSGRLRAGVLTAVLLDLAGVPHPDIIAAEEPTGAPAVAAALRRLRDDHGGAATYLRTHGVPDPALRRFTERFVAEPKPSPLRAVA